MNIRSNLVAAAAATFLVTGFASAQTMTTPLDNTEPITVADIINEFDEPRVDENGVQDAEFMDEVRIPGAVSCEVFGDELDDEGGNFVIMRVAGHHDVAGRKIHGYSPDVCVPTGGELVSIDENAPSTDGESWVLQFTLRPGDGRPPMPIYLLIEQPEDVYKLEHSTRLIVSYTLQAWTPPPPVIEDTEGDG